MHKIGSINVLGLGSHWKQYYLLIDIKSKNIDQMAISDTKLHSSCTLIYMISGQFNIYYSLFLLNIDGGDYAVRF